MQELEPWSTVFTSLFDWKSSYVYMNILKQFDAETIIFYFTKWYVIFTCINKMVAYQHIYLWEVQTTHMFGILGCDYKIKATSGVVNSPGHGVGKKYPSLISCSILITTPNDTPLSIYFPKNYRFSIESNDKLAVRYQTSRTYLF